MTESKIIQALDELFAAAPTVMASLGNEFTYHQFLRALMDHQKHAYIDLLYANRHREDPFDAAQQQVGKRLKQMAQDAGYERIEDGKDLSIFDRETLRITYRR
ncbi:MAG: hypothetical protein IT320_03485 [Anaerolineae bacterium]|nr:hypothetical protein [Anaerolineae bacterium]